MNTTSMIDRMTEPRFMARTAGAFYLLMFPIGGLFFSRRALVVTGNSAATATNILAHVPLFRAAFAGDLLVVACYIVVTALFYELFKPVSRSVSLIAAFFSVVGCTIQGFACVFQLGSLVVLGPEQYLSVFNVEQRQALAFLSLKLYSQAYGIALVFFAFYGLLIGCLILKSTFLPRFLGVLMVLAGLGWLTFLYPPFATKYFPYILPTSLGEGFLTLWLLVKGVNAERWNEQARASRQPQVTQ